jgi:hypothetical protein
MMPTLQPSADRFSRPAGAPLPLRISTVSDSIGGRLGDQ